ncbi:hypothetical protein TNCV_2476131 [Trichonephila clavipes]|nr:hypothetical protein TNCV_2476131 [Trichonephila clavipes]
MSDPISKLDRPDHLRTLGDVCTLEPKHALLVKNLVIMPVCVPCAAEHYPAEEQSQGSVRRRKTLEHR